MHDLLQKHFKELSLIFLAYCRSVLGSDTAEDATEMEMAEFYDFVDECRLETKAGQLRPDDQPVHQGQRRQLRAGARGAPRRRAARPAPSATARPTEVVARSRAPTTARRPRRTRSSSSTSSSRCSCASPSSAPTRPLATLATRRRWCTLAGLPQVDARGGGPAARAQGHVGRLPRDGDDRALGALNGARTTPAYRACSDTLVPRDPRVHHVDSRSSGLLGNAVCESTDELPSIHR